MFYSLGCSLHWHCCSRWCCHLIGVTTCIDVVFLACSCFFSHCFTIVLHCIVLMFSLHVIVVFHALMVLHYSSCSTFFALVISMSFFSSYCVVHFTLLCCYFFSHCCIFFSFSHSLNHVALLTLSRSSFRVASLLFSHYCIVLLALPSLLFLHCRSFCNVTPFALVLSIPS